MMKPTLETIRTCLSGHAPVKADMEDRIPAAVAMILVEAEAGVEILLIKRTERDRDPWSGQMALPGGHMEIRDESLLDTAIRETLEETAVDLSKTEFIGELNDVNPSTPLLPPILIRPFVFILESKPATRPNEEVDFCVWVQLSELAGARVTEEVHVRGFNISTVGYRIGDHLVWGLTGRILAPFLQILGQG